MPSWKKVVVSGSDASFSSLYVTNAVTASAFTGSFVGDGSGLTNLTYGDFATGSFVSQATWSFTHNLGFKYAAIEVYDQNDFVIIPSETKIIDAQSVEIRFTSPQTGTALATLGTGVVSGSVFNPSALLTKASFNTYTGSATSQFAGTSSYTVTASYAVSASVATTSLNTADILVYVKNVTGASIPKGKVVRISGATGDNALISTASWDSDGVSANTLGILNETIADQSFGYVITEGRLLGINTDNFTAGQLLFLGPTGSIIGYEPVAPKHAVRLGQVLRVQSNNGSMYVRIDNGYEIDELHNVLIISGSDGDLLVASGSNNNGKKLYINSKQLTGSYAITGSLNATAVTASAFTIATQPTTSYTTRQILMRNSSSGQIEITDSTSPAIYNFGMSYAMSTFNYLT